MPGVVFRQRGRAVRWCSARGRPEPGCRRDPLSVKTAGCVTGSQTPFVNQIEKEGKKKNEKRADKERTRKQTEKKAKKSGCAFISKCCEQLAAGVADSVSWV